MAQSLPMKPRKTLRETLLENRKAEESWANAFGTTLRDDLEAVADKHELGRMPNLIMPWPPASLSPNTRSHWAVLAKAKKKYRSECALQSKAQGARQMDADRLEVSFVFYPPTKRRIDLDNCISRMKSGIDGIVDVLGVDDSRWKMSFEMAESTGGIVRVNIKEIGETDFVICAEDY